MLIAFELGGRASSHLARELGLLLSCDVLVRRIRRSPLPAKLAEEVRVLGVDDWALLKGERCGTILLDLERSRVVVLLPDRSVETLDQWLLEHPGVEVISRDRYRSYIEGASTGAPDAVANHLRCLRKGSVHPLAHPRLERTKGTRYESQEITRLLMLEARDQDTMHPDQSQYLAELRKRCPELADAQQQLAGSFAKIVCKVEEEKLGNWFEEAEKSTLPEIRTFVRGIRQDEEAVRAAISLPWSNAQVEGRVSKLIEKQM